MSDRPPTPPESPPRTPPRRTQPRERIFTRSPESPPRTPPRFIRPQPARPMRVLHIEEAPEAAEPIVRARPMPRVRRQMDELMETLRDQWFREQQEALRPPPNEIPPMNLDALFMGVMEDQPPRTPPRRQPQNRREIRTPPTAATRTPSPATTPASERELNDELERVDADLQRRMLPPVPRVLQRANRRRPRGDEDDEETPQRRVRRRTGRGGR